MTNENYSACMVYLALASGDKFKEDATVGQATVQSGIHGDNMVRFNLFPVSLVSSGTLDV
jgi:hypothetical protein